jgi:hypothetical protein
MKNATTILLALAVAILGAFAYSQSLATKDQQTKLAQLATAVHEKAKTGNLDLQQKCAAQAHAQYVQSGWGKDPSAGFVNHYNEKMNSCFMVISSTDTKISPGNVFMNFTLVDAFEGKVFGNYIWRSDPVKKYWEVKPFMCDITLPSGEKKVCHSDAEFKELIKVYMGDMANQ